MRTNLPVTSNEYVLSDNDIIVTKTDLKGKITYVNRDFLRISGFSEQEAVRAPHNIVRHPDMPEEAFEDLWNTLKRGKSWKGIVKNRCKNGDSYWVEANVAPILQNRQTVGFTSIRTKPRREKVIAAEAIYGAIKAGSRDYEIREGIAVKRGIQGRIQSIRTASIKTSMQVCTGILTGLFVIGALACAGMLPSRSMNLAAGACVLGATLTVLFCHRFYRNLVFALDLVRQNVERMSAGDLSGHIPSHGNDEIGHLMQSLRILQTNVKLLVGQIKECAEVVNIGSREIASGNADLSERTESQASSLEETASSMEELTSIVRDNAENAREANAMVAKAAQIAVTSSSTVTQMVVMMEAINESARKITEIIGVIDGIAFQTNLLALNSAVEAARAGEQGRGFAVVASEVRNLAQRSATAAREIQALIADSAEKVASGSRMAGAAGQAMDEVVGAIKHVAAVMDDISRASVEQSAGIEQVNVAITRMDEATQQNAALVEQATAASGSLQEQATRLVDLVQSFRLLTGSYADSNLVSPRTPANGGRILISA